MSILRSFPFIPVKADQFRILKRMGYNSRKAEVSERMMEEVDTFISRATEILELKGVCLRLDIEIDSDSGEIRISGSGNSPDAVFKSRKLCDFLEGADQILLMGITGGAAAAEEIHNLQIEKKMTAAVVIDAAASEIVDDGFDWIAALYSKELLREGRALTGRRFSAGYGDFDISHQQLIFKMLELQNLGLTITESSMLLPEKSVTALYGIIPRS